MSDTLRKLLALVSREQRWAWLSLVPLAVFSAALEAVGAVAVLGLIQLVSEPEAAASNPLVGFLQAWLPGIAPDRLLAYFAVCVGCFYVFKNMVRLCETYARQACASNTAVAISTRLLRAYLEAPYPFHLRRNSTELLRNTHTLSESVSRAALNSATSLLSELLVVLGILAVVIHSAPSIAVGVGLGTAVLMVGLLRVTQRQHQRWGRRTHDLHNAMMQTLQQSLAGVKEVKVLGREANFTRAFAGLRRRYGRMLIWRGTAEMVPRLVVETLFVAGVVGLIVVAQFRSQANLIPVLGLFAYAGLRILPSLHWILYHGNEIRFSGAPIDVLYRDWTELRAGAAPVDEVPPPPLPFRERIEIEDLSFRYPGSQRAALREVNLVIPRGASIGIVGPTGAGKTTLIDLVLGLLQPTAGHIRVDGLDIQEHTRSWQRQIGYVPQALHLLDDTIRRNIALGVEDAAIDEARVLEASDMAQLRDFLEQLPDGLDTVVGDRGVRISGGERQRVAVARALYRDPEVLVFDEATAALDNESERALTRAIESLQRKKTLLIVAHRLTTVRRCDQLIFLRDGRVADVGPYDELEARNPEFRRMATP